MGQWLLSITIPLIFVFFDSGDCSRRYKPCSWLFQSNPEDCRTYYQCDHGKTLLRHCGLGLHWNSDFNTCDLAENAGCRLVNEEIMNSNSLFSITDGSQLENSSCSENGVTTPHPTDCNCYYQCNQGKNIHRCCPETLHWNPKMSICDWPSSAGCTATGNPTSTTTTTTTTPSPASTSTSTSTPPPDTTTTEMTTTTSTSTTTSTTTTERPSTIAPPPPPPSPSPGYKVICYFTNWAWYRQDKGKFGPKDIDASLCTHIVYAFAVLDEQTWTIRPSDTWLDLDSKFYQQVTDLRQKGTKVTMAIGGWNDSAGDKYSKLVRDPSKRATFVASCSQFIKEHNFDGLDLDWEYPGCPQGDCSKGLDSDKTDFARLIKEMRVAMPNAILSAAVSCNKNVIDKGYHVRAMSKYLDWIALMAYDFHGSWEKQTGHIAPLYFHPNDYVDYLSSDAAMYHWMSKGADSQKLILGMPMYGQTFTLSNSTNNGLNAPTKGPGQSGDFTRQAGTLAYYEICLTKWDILVEDVKGRIGPYAVNGDQWVSYDNIKSMRKKISYVRNEQLGGVMVWALDLDDFKDVCGQGKYPLLSALSRSLRFDGSRARPQKPTPAPSVPPTPYTNSNYRYSYSTLY